MNMSEPFFTERLSLLLKLETIGLQPHIATKDFYLAQFANPAGMLSRVRTHYLPGNSPHRALEVLDPPARGYDTRHWRIAAE
jgi:hypothetical protein